MTKEEAKKRIKKLREAIDEYRYSYHVLNKSIISEAALDSLKHELFKLEQEYPELITPDSPTQRVAGAPLSGFKKVTHKTPMLSMEDVFDSGELEAWNERIQKIVPAAKLDFYAEIKMDGLAVSLVYRDGLFYQGSTRGDGAVGEDVTANLKTIEAIPLKLREAKGIKIGREIEIRGEAYMSKKAFDELNREQKKKGEEPFANPRNAAAGAIRQLDPKITASRKLSFYGYALATDLGRKTHEEAHELIAKLGVPVNPLNAAAKNLEEINQFHEKIQKIREKLPYWTDGVVAVVNDDKIFERLGVVGKAPRGIIAYKFPAEQATTKVKEVRWQVGRTGALTPVAVMEPVFVGGTTVAHATLHNMDEIERLGLKIGDTVILEKAGDIIPKIIKVLRNLRTGGERALIAPKKCPVCGRETLRKGGGVAIVCQNKNCPAKDLERVIHFASKRAFDIDGLGPKQIEIFMNKGLVGGPADLFKLEKSDLVDLERFGEKSAENIIRAIAERKNISLSRFIISLGILHVGDETAADLAEHFGILEKFRAADIDELMKIEGVGEVVAESIDEWLKSEANQRLVDELLKAGVKVEAASKPKRQPLAGRIFVFTGELETISRDNAKDAVRRMGGDPTEAVSKKTDYVVAGPGAGSKLDKAKKLGVKVIDEKEFLKMVK
ncbi:NAD-dependent DNA ligase LigA [Candidatus Uhrbacteria bacterium]|nr:NAD-dependent DNA ligase LigA [Candidatus Uhrbacteria bacterium]